MEMHLNLNQSEDSMGEEEEEEEIPERGELEESIEGLQQIKTDEMFLSKTPQLPLRSRTRRVPESDHGERLQTPPHSSLNVEELAAITMPITPLSPPMMDEQPSSVMEAKREKMDEDVQQVAVDDVMTNDEEVRERSISSGSQKSVTFSEPGDQHKDSDSLSQKTPEVPESGHKVRDSDSITRELLERLNKLKVQAAQKEGAGRDPNASLAEAFSQKLRIESASSPLDEAPVGQSKAAPVINDIYLTKSPQPKSKSEMREVFTLDLDDSDAELSEGSQVGSPMIGISDIPITLVDVSPVGTPTQTPKLQRAHMSLMSAHMTASKGRGVATEVTMTPPGSKDQSPRQTPSEQSSPPRLEQEESTGRQEPVMEKSHTPTIEETQELIERLNMTVTQPQQSKSTSSHSQSPKSPPPTPEENYQSQEGSVHSQHSSRQSPTGEISVSRGKQSHKDKLSPEVSPLQSPRTELLTTQRQTSSKEGSEHESQPETPTGTESSAEVETKQKSPQLSQPDSPRSPGEGEFSNESARPTTEGSSPVTGQTKVSVHSSHSTSPEQSFSDGSVKESSLEKQDDKQIDRISRSSSSDHEISSEDKQDSGHFGSIDKTSPDKEPLKLLEETTEKELSIDTSQAGSHGSPHLPQGEESAMKQGSLHSSRSVSPSDQKSPINQDDLIKHSSEYDSSLQKETSTKPVSPALLDDSMTPPHESIPMSPLTSDLHSYESAEKQTDKKAEIDIFGLGDESVLIPPSPLSAEDKAPTRDIGSPTDQQQIPEMDEL
ncbi:enolase-phosphatase E1-like [Ptychodera flava]|uniref:enolase-phosphatase E1-like n=1 Tax=Ptychodera flava TaxID=63121 RepID=UPI00396A8021